MGGILVNDFVAGEETQNVVEVLECFNDTKYLLIVARSVGGPRFSTVQRTSGEGRVDIENHVDASSVENRDTLIVIEIWGQVVDTNGIDL